jgi:hypothetical protein
VTGAGSFTQALKTDIASLKIGTLPLDKGVSQGGYVDDSNMVITVLHVTENENRILARVGVFFTEAVRPDGVARQSLR